MRVLRCTVCRSEDHNASTCPERRAVVTPPSVYRCGLCRCSGHFTECCPKRPANRRVWCPHCAGLPHRRPETGCRACGEPYAPDTVKRVDATIRSSLGGTAAALRL